MRILMMFVAALLVLSVGPGSAAAEQNLLSEADIKQVVSRHAHEIKRCYKRHAIKQRSARGKVTLGMIVSRKGKVRRRSVSVAAPGVRGRKFKRCVVRKVKAWEFPASRSATEVQYPFFFQHARRYR